MELIRKTIGQCLRECAKQAGTELALEIENWSCTYQQLDVIVDRKALQMIKLGIRKGMHVGIWGVNSAEWVVHFLALTRCGATPILINTLYKQEELKKVLNYSDVEILYYGNGHKKLDYELIIADVFLEIPKVRFFIDMEEGKYNFFPEKLNKREREIISKAESRILADDVSCMIFTSGTTSDPKGVMLTHYNVVNNAIAMAEHMHWCKGDKMCLTVPLFHCFGITASLVPALVCGITMQLIPFFRTAKIWEVIEKKSCNILNGVPSMFMALVSKKEYAHINTAGLKSGIIAGSPISEMEYEMICNRFSEMHLQIAYGQTETSPCISISDWNTPIKEKAKTVGRVIEHVQVRIADINSQKILNPKEDGEIQVKGYNVMQGYYEREEENQKVFTKDGWLRTGDIGHLDVNHTLSITGRLKEIIIRSGENIAPIEVENEIRKLDWVVDVKVIGVPSPVTQEAVTACIISKKGHVMDTIELVEYLEDRLANYKVPEFILEFQSFPMNATGKIKIEKLKEEAIQKIKNNQKNNSFKEA